MTRWTVLTVAAVTNVVAVVALAAALWWGGGAGTAKTLALAGTAVIATASLVIVFVVRRSARLAVLEPGELPHDHSGWPHQPPPRVDVEFRDRGERFGPP
jgi:hypothetical protein